MIPATQNTLSPSFTTIPGKYFKMEISVFYLVVYQSIWDIMHVAGTITGGEGALLFHDQNQTAETQHSCSSCYSDWPFPLSSDTELRGTVVRKLNCVMRDDRQWLWSHNREVRSHFLLLSVPVSCCEWKLSTNIQPWQIDIWNEWAGLEPHAPLWWKE